MTSSPFTPEQRRLRSKIGNDTRWSQVPFADRPAHTQAARDARWAGYLDRVDPDGVLPEAEREALARKALSADMARLALKAVTARKHKTAAARKAKAAARARAAEEDGAET
jgi:hypothetical protein